MTTIDLSPQDAIIVEQILKSVKHAENKHPEFAWQDNHTRYLALSEEVGEIAKSLLENDGRHKLEALDAIAVLYRFLKVL